MTNISRKIFIGSLTSLTVMASSVVFAEEMVTAPSFEGGVTASIGTFYAVPSVDNDEFLVIQDGSQVTIENATADYDFGFEASLGYLFEDTANGIELSYRGFNTDTTSNSFDGLGANGFELSDAQNKISYEQNALDLMISQYMDIGTHMQMRFNGGLSYVELEQEQNITGLIFSTEFPEDVTHVHGKEKSEYKGLGPRVGVDARYDFGEEIQGFGIVGGASAAYFLGETDLIATAVSTNDLREDESVQITDDADSQAVTNLRANLGVDYVYFFDNEGRSTLGLEIGYMVDFYDNAVTTFTDLEGIAPVSTAKTNSYVTTTTGPVTFSGPYVNLKGVF